MCDQLTLQELSYTYTPLLIPVLEICQRGALTSLEFGPVTVCPPPPPFPSRAIVHVRTAMHAPHLCVQSYFQW